MITKNFEIPKSLKSQYKSSTQSLDWTMDEPQDLESDEIYKENYRECKIWFNKNKMFFPKHLTVKLGDCHHRKRSLLYFLFTPIPFSKYTSFGQGISLMIPTATFIKQRNKVYETYRDISNEYNKTHSKEIYEYEENLKKL